MDTKKIGFAIKKYREIKGLSQFQLGLAIGNDSAFISKIENHKRLPTILTVYKIAVALDVNPVDIFKEIFSEQK